MFSQKFWRLTLVIREKILVRGTSHHKGSLTAYNRGYLVQGTELRLKREPDNNFDKNAVEIYLKKPLIKLGYVPKELALKFSRLVEGSRVDQAVVTHASYNDKYLEIRVEITYRYVEASTKKSTLWVSSLAMPYSAGVYSITNTVNRRKYIGSSLKIRVRLFSHILDLLFEIHSNVPLATEFKKYGINNFKAELITKTHPATAKEIEAKTILDSLRRGEPLYNMTETGEPPTEGPRGGTLSVSEWDFDWEDYELEKTDDDNKYFWSGINVTDVVNGTSPETPVKEEEVVHLLLPLYNSLFCDMNDYISNQTNYLSINNKTIEIISFCTATVLSAYSIAHINMTGFYPSRYNKHCYIFLNDITNILNSSKINDCQDVICTLEDKVNSYRCLYNDAEPTADFTKMCRTFVKALSVTESIDISHVENTYNIFWKHKDIISEQIKMADSQLLSDLNLYLNNNSSQSPPTIKRW